MQDKLVRLIEQLKFTLTRLKWERTEEGEKVMDEIYSVLAEIQYLVYKL